LNIWVSDPPPTHPAPVIVWLHTGAFSGASANFASHNGRRLAEEQGVIIVAPNYRHGPFGFLAHAALAAEDPAFQSTGNYGLLDQRAALNWVRDNIAYFGGDPWNVTIAGTSAGGQSVGLHLVSPGSQGSFSARSSKVHSQLCVPEADRSGCSRTAIRDRAGLRRPGDGPALHAIQDTKRGATGLTQATEQVVEPFNRVHWRPIVDGLVIPDEPRTLFERGAFHEVPLIVGSNKDEGWGSFITRSFRRASVWRSTNPG
jgi:para-nitrobenzyl esterase